MALPENKPNLKLGFRYSEHKDDPPPGLVWRKGKKGETLGSIADEYGIRWLDIGLYNWHTANPFEINWYLHNWVKCTKDNGHAYVFTGDEKSGQVLVPNIPPSVKKGPSRSVAIIRDGKAKQDTTLQVNVIEWVAGGADIKVTGKWVYVFSGTGGVAFGYDPPSPLPQTDAPPDGQPGSAFTLDFPGVFPIAEKPNKLEYEILVTSNDAPSTSLQMAAAGKAMSGDPYYKYGSNWYFLSDPTILGKALTDARNTRTTHAFRNTSVVTIDLAGNTKRYYFLLSPVQLGPEALKYAMDHPKALTPLLKPNSNGAQWDQYGSKTPARDYYYGPLAEDVKNGIITLPVIDPYAWAENLAEYGYRTALQEFANWMGTDATSGKKYETINQLRIDTHWDLDQFYVAQILKAVRGSHPKPGSIDDELKDPDQWRSNLISWEGELVQRNAEINANAHRSLLELTEWMAAPGHAIIETAVLKDTNADSPQDAIDTARAILHWSVCTEHITALLPGVSFLQDLLKKTGSVPTDIVFKDLDLGGGTTTTLPATHQKAFRYAAQGVLDLLALKDFVSPPPNIASSGSRDDYLAQLGTYEATRRDALIKMLNDIKILPAKVQAPKLTPVTQTTSKTMIAATAINGMLDVADKWTTYVIDPDINIPRRFGLNWLANLEEWFQKRPTFAKFSNIGTSYALKSVSLVLNGYNLYTAVTTARYDYQTNQMSVTKTDYAQAISGTILAVQDTLAEVAVLLKSQGLTRLFPQLMTTSGGPAWGVGAARVTGIAGGTFATINVLAMLVSGVATVISMERARGKAISRGDYTAAKFYRVGSFGGGVMVAGGLAFGWGLMEAAGIVSSTGIGATVGVVLFLIGGIIAAVASIFAWLASSDDFQVFARKCFLGKQGTEEPRFGDDPPAWSEALGSGYNTWPVLKQKVGIHNLLGQFTVKTTPQNGPDSYGFDFMGKIMYEITPGMFTPGSTIQFEVYYGSYRSSVTYVWEPDGPPSKDHRIIAVDGKDVFDAAQTSIYFRQVSGPGTSKPDQDPSIDKISFWVERMVYNGHVGKMLTQVTVRYPALANVIRMRKLVMEYSSPKMDFDDNEVTSGIFESK